MAAPNHLSVCWVSLSLQLLDLKKWRKHRELKMEKGQNECQGRGREGSTQEWGMKESVRVNKKEGG